MGGCYRRAGVMGYFSSALETKPAVNCKIAILKVDPIKSVW